MVCGRATSGAKAAAECIDAEGNDLYFSVVSLWETAIKNALGRQSFRVDVRRLRRLLLSGGYRELSIEAEHALVVLPSLHKDPFHRMLVAQAAAEGLTLLISDAALGRYADCAPIWLV